MVQLDCCRRSQSNPLYDKPAREKHFFSMAASIISVVLLIISLPLPSWATAVVADHYCNFGLIKVSCMTTKTKESIYQENISLASYYSTPQQILISCVLSISVLTMISSLIAAFISAGFPREKLEFLRHYSVFNIVSLLCIILVAGFWLSVVETLPGNGANGKVNYAMYKDTVVFGYGFYTYMAGGVMSLIAGCLNLLRARSAVERRMTHRNRFRRQLWRRDQQRRPRPLVQLLRAPRSLTEQRSRQHTEGTNEGNTLPEYTAEATTEFIENHSTPELQEEGEVRVDSSDTEPLVSPPPPYTP